MLSNCFPKHWINSHSYQQYINDHLIKHNSFVNTRSHFFLTFDNVINEVDVSFLSVFSLIIKKAQYFNLLFGYFYFCVFEESNHMNQPILNRAIFFHPNGSSQLFIYVRNLLFKIYVENISISISIFILLTEWFFFFFGCLVKSKKMLLPKYELSTDQL